jgi:hypothetical protein
MKAIQFVLVFLLSLVTSACGSYSFSGIQTDAKTVQVKYFQNTAPLVEPGIERIFTNKLQETIQNQTSLGLTNSKADLIYEGEIIDYRIAPMTSTANYTAAQNRLTITVLVKFTNTKKEEDNFEKRFSFFKDYEGDAQLTGSKLTELVDFIYAQIIQDVMNESLAKW